MQHSFSDKIQSALGNVKFPASKNQLLEEAKKQNVSDDVLAVLENCPDRHYNNSDDVIQECKIKSNW